MVSRLIDLPFTRGLDESTDDTVLAPPGMVDLVNYRLTRAGRLEHRLGVADQSCATSVYNFTGDRPEGNKPQALYGRFLAAGGHGYTCLTQGAWLCVGSVSRFVPTESYPAYQESSRSFDSASCASVNGFLVVLGTENPNPGTAQAVVFDERTGEPVFRVSFGRAGGSATVCSRVVASGSNAVIVWLDTATGDIVGNTIDLSGTYPLALSADVTIVAAATAAAGIDAAPLDSSAFIVSYFVGANAAMRLVNSTTFATILGPALVSDGAGTKLTTCLATVTPRNYYLAWLNTTTRNVVVAVFDNTLTQVGANVILGNAPGTVFSTDNFHPVIGRRSSSEVVVGWTDSYVVGVFQTYRTTFRDATNAAAAGTTYGPMYGYYLASKPFRTSAPFFEGFAQPAVWLANQNPTVTDFDRSYFLMLLGEFSSVTNNEACSWEMSASPSAAVSAIRLLGQQLQVPEVVLSTTTGPFNWQTVHQESFRGLGTATPQRKLQVYRFGDGAISFRARTRQVIPCQGSFVVLGGAPRYYDTDRLVELGMAHGPTVIRATSAATGSMAPGDYRYVFVFEYFDGQGQRCLSYVSNPMVVTVAPGDAQVNFEILASAAWAFTNTTTDLDTFRRNLVVRPYRTGLNGTVYRYSPPTASPNGTFAGPLLAFGRIQLQDVNSDLQIAGNEAVYTQVGNALSNYRAPPSRFGCEHEGRLVLGGGWNPKEFTVSKLFFAGEGIQFTESASFKIPPITEDGTGCASLDGTLVLFSERSIYAVIGDGPTDDGAGGFTQPRRLPGRVGCLDWRSIITTDAGVMFRAADGFRLLPRGLGATMFIGAPIQNKTRLYPETLGAAVVTRQVAPGVSDHDSEQVACWLIGNAEEPTAVKIFTYSLLTQVWAEVSLPEDVSNLQNVLGVWRDLVNNTDVLGFAREEIATSVAGSLLVENPGTNYDRDISGSFEPLLAGSWRTGKVFPFGFGGRGTIRALRLVGECLAPTTLAPTVYSDANPAGYASSTLTFAAGRFAVQLELRQKDIEWVQVGMADPTTGSGNRGAGLRFNGLALEVEMDPGLIRLPAANRST